MGMTAALIGGASLVGSVASAAIGAGGAKSAAQTQAQSAANANATQLQMFGQTQQNLSPFIQAGQNAVGALGGMLPMLASPYGGPQFQQQDPFAVPNTTPQIGSIPNYNPLQARDVGGYGPQYTPQSFANFAPYTPQSFGNYAPMAPISGPSWQPTMEQLEQTPGYQFQLQQGEKAINNQNSSTGWGLSGPGQKALAGYAEGLASTTYQNQFDNYLRQQQQGYNQYTGQYQQNFGNYWAQNQNQLANAMGQYSLGFDSNWTQNMNQLQAGMGQYQLGFGDYWAQNQNQFDNNLKQYQQQFQDYWSQNQQGFNNQLTQNQNLFGQQQSQFGDMNTNLQNYMQQFQQQFGNYWGQNQNIYNMISGLAGLGGNAAAGLGTTSAQVGNQIGQNIIGAGNARAAGTLGAANAYAAVPQNALLNYAMANNILNSSSGPAAMSGYDPWTSAGNNLYNPYMTNPAVPNGPVSYMFQ